MRGGIPVFIKRLTIITMFSFKMIHANNSIKLLMLCHITKISILFIININSQFRISITNQIKNHLLNLSLITHNNRYGKNIINCKY